MNFGLTGAACLSCGCHSTFSGSVSEATNVRGCAKYKTRVCARPRVWIIARVTGPRPWRWLRIPCGAALLPVRPGLLQSAVLPSGCRICCGSSAARPAAARLLAAGAALCWPALLPPGCRFSAARPGCCLIFQGCALRPVVLDLSRPGCCWAGCNRFILFPARIQPGPVKICQRPGCCRSGAGAAGLRCCRRPAADPGRPGPLRPGSRLPVLPLVHCSRQRSNVGAKPFTRPCYIT